MGKFFRIFLFTAFALTAYSSRAFSISLLFSPERQTVAEGDVVTVKILVSDHSIQGDMFALDFRLLYDPAYLKLVDKSGVETLTIQSSISWKGGFVPSVDISKGIIEYSGMNLVSVFCAGQGIQSSYPIIVAEISFKALKKGETILKYDTSMNPIEIFMSPTVVYLNSLGSSCTDATIPATNTAKITIGDSVAPEISGVNILNISRESAVIKWSTNEPATGQVEYGLDTNYGKLSTENLTLSAQHSLTLKSLSPQTLYHFRVKSRDSSGNESVSEDNSFSTTASAFSLSPRPKQNPSRNGSAVFYYLTGPSAARVLIEIFTISGKRVESIEGNLNGETKWNWGNGIASGIYIYRITVFSTDTTSESIIGKLAVLK